MTEREQQGLMRLRVELYTAAQLLKGDALAERLRVELYTAAQLLKGDALAEFTALIREIAMILDIVRRVFECEDEVVSTCARVGEHVFELGKPTCGCGAKHAHYDAPPVSSAVSNATAESQTPREAPATCSSCSTVLVFSARARGDGLCGPCSRKASGTSTPGDLARERWRP